MIANSSRASGPSSTGGFGQPSGAGGRPPKKPGGFSPIKGHYNSDPDEDSDDTNKHKNKKKKTQEEKDKHAAYMREKRAQDGPGKRKDEHKRRHDNMTREEKDKRNEKSQTSRDNVNFLSQVETNINSLERYLSDHEEMQQSNPLEYRIRSEHIRSLRELVDNMYNDENFYIPKRKRTRDE
jgi:hypothetical protein